MKADEDEDAWVARNHVVILYGFKEKSTINFQVQTGLGDIQGLTIWKSL